jgi:cytochrome c-type biogenesis protein CcsB
VDAYLAGDQVSFNQAARDYTTAVRGMNLPYLERRVLGFDALRLEVDYNRLRPFRWAWYAYLAGFLLLLVSLFWARIAVPAYALVLGAFLLHTYGFFLRCAIAGRPPVSNMYESVIWVSWAAVIFSLALFTVYRSRYLVMAASALAAFGLVVADSFPAVLDPSIAPLVPVLRSNLWLTVHVLTITLSYGAFALALGIGHIQLFAYAFTPEKEEALRNLSQFLYRALQIGVVLLAAGTILGGVWANYSWGRFWGWDPKETWALIALLGYLALLHGRFAGWLGPYGLAVGSVVAFQGILMAWYGVNFVLAAGLHSYGFGGGGVAYVLAAVAVDLALVGGLILAHRARRSKSPLAQ